MGTGSNSSPEAHDDLARLHGRAGIEPGRKRRRSASVSSCTDCPDDSSIEAECPACFHVTVRVGNERLLHSDLGREAHAGPSLEGHTPVHGHDVLAQYAIQLLISLAGMSIHMMNMTKY